MMTNSEGGSANVLSKVCRRLLPNLARRLQRPSGVVHGQAGLNCGHGEFGRANHLGGRDTVERHDADFGRPIANEGLQQGRCHGNIFAESYLPLCGILLSSYFDARSFT
eukprot:8150268-Pyramimonas_sp.AAC.1